MCKIINLFKLFCFTALLLGGSHFLNAQTNKWTLVNGLDTTNVPAVYTAKGQFAPANTPGQRAIANTWVDENNLWLFGGQDGNGSINDLWKYNITSNEWAWVSGPHSEMSTGRYGVKRKSAITNQPAARKGGVSWKDKAGNLWMFGGSNELYLNDVWKYNIDSSLWTWMHGDSIESPPSNYGKIDAAAATNTPGGRNLATGWVGKDGLFWMYGGFGLDNNSNFGDYNDLWNYNPLTNQWTWVNGDTTVNPPIIYGGLGQVAAGNNPGPRYGVANWVDSAGNLWLFGGTNNNNAYFNDLWKYDISLNDWIWMNGSDQEFQAATYGTLAKPAAANTPGAIQFPQYWTDPNGDFWLWGGYGYVSATREQGVLNDMWKYNVNSNQWAWMGGSQMMNPTDTAGTPNAREYAECWTDTSGALWMYGGFTGSVFFYGGLWKYDTDTISSITATINPVNSFSLTVYPNPGNGQFTVSLSQASQLTVYNSLGQLIVTQNMQAGQQQLNLGYQPSGVYSLIVTNGQTQQAIKLVVE